MNVKFTVIDHNARIGLGIDLITYCIASSVYTLSNSPKAIVKGWCNATRDYFAEWLGVSKRTVINHINILVDLDLIEKDNYTNYLRTTEKWYFAIEATEIETDKNRGEKVAPTMQKLHGRGEKVAPPPCKSCTPVYKVDNNINKDINSDTPPLKFYDNETVIKNAEELKTTLHNSDMWQENLKRTLKIPVSKNINPLLSEFIDEIASRGKEYQNLQKIKEHAYFWMQKHGAEKAGVPQNIVFDYDNKQLIEKHSTRLLYALLKTDLPGELKKAEKIRLLNDFIQQLYINRHFHLKFDEVEKMAIENIGSKLKDNERISVNG